MAVFWKPKDETKVFLTPPNAIRLQWQSASGGNWMAQIEAGDSRNRAPGLDGHNLWGINSTGLAISLKRYPDTGQAPIIRL